MVLSKKANINLFVMKMCVKAAKIARNLGIIEIVFSDIIRPYT